MHEISLIFSEIVLLVILLSRDLYEKPIVQQQDPAFFQPFQWVLVWFYWTSTILHSIKCYYRRCKRTKDEQRRKMKTDQRVEEDEEKIHQKFVMKNAGLDEKSVSHKNVFLN